MTTSGRATLGTALLGIGLIAAAASPALAQKGLDEPFQGAFKEALAGKTVALTGKLSPRLFGLFMQQMRLRAVRRLPIAFGWLTMRGDRATARWMRPVLKQPEIRRDAVRMLRAAMSDTHLMLKAAEGLPGFNRPALVVWATGDRVMPLEHGRRLAELLQAQLVEVADSYTLIPLDQPARLAQAVREFTRASATQLG